MNLCRTYTKMVNNADDEDDEQCRNKEMNPKPYVFSSFSRL